MEASLLKKEKNLSSCFKFHFLSLEIIIHFKYTCLKEIKDIECQFGDRNNAYFTGSLMVIEFFIESGFVCHDRHGEEQRTHFCCFLEVGFVALAAI